MFHDCIVPLITNESEFLEIKSRVANSFDFFDDEDDEHEIASINMSKPLDAHKPDSLYYTIIKTTIELNAIPGVQQLLDILNQFIQLLVKHVDSDGLKRLVDEVARSRDWPTLFRTAWPVRDLFEYRCGWLHANIVADDNIPSNTWSMCEARLDGHPIVEEFLHAANRRTLNYDGKFATFKDVLEFCRFCERASKSCLTSGFSIKCEPLGIRADALVAISKTTDYYDKKHQQNEMFKQELALLTDLLKHT